MNKTPNQQNLSELYKQQAPSLYRYFQLRVIDPREAEDLLSESFSRLLAGADKAAGLTEVEQVKWLFGIGRNVLREKYRELANDPVTMPEDFDPVDENIAIEDQVADEQLKQEAISALRELPFAQAEVISLKLWEDKTFGQIGELTEQSENTVKSHYYRGLRSLRSRFNGTHLGVILATIVAAKALPELVIPASALALGGAFAAGGATTASTTIGSISSATVGSTTAATVGAGGMVISKGVAIVAAAILAVGTIAGVATGLIIHNNNARNADPIVSAPVSAPAGGQNGNGNEQPDGPVGNPQAPPTVEKTPFVLVATDSSVVKRNLIDGSETEVLGGLTACNKGDQDLTFLPASRYNRNIMGIWCGQKVYILTESGEVLDINLAAYIPADYGLTGLELSQDKNLLAFSTAKLTSGGQYKLHVYNRQTAKARAYVVEYKAAFDYTDPIIPLYFSTDNTRLFAFPGVGAGYLTDRFLSFNLADGKYTQLKGFDINNSGQIVAAKGNVDSQGNIYAWEYNEGPGNDNLLKYDIKTGKVIDRIDLTTRIEAISPADTTTPFDGIDPQTGLVHFTAYSTACIAPELTPNVSCDESKIGLVIFDFAAKKIKYDLRGYKITLNGYSLGEYDGQFYVMSRNSSGNSYTLKSMDLATKQFKDIKTYNTKQASSSLVFL